MNHTDFERDTLLTFTHPRSRSCDIDVKFTQERDIYDIRFEEDGRDFLYSDFMDGSVMVHSDFTAPLLVRGGRGECSVFVRKEAASVSDGEIKGWYVTDNDNSVEITDVSLYGEVLSDYVPYTIIEDDAPVETGDSEEDATVSGLTYNKYLIGIRCYGPTDTDDFTLYRYSVVAMHSDSPSNYTASYVIRYTVPDGVAPISSAPSFVAGGTMDWDNIVFDKQEIEIAEGIGEIEMAPVQEGAEEIVYELSYADSDQATTLSISDIQTSVSVKFNVQPHEATVFTHQSSDFLNFDVGEGDVEGEKVVRISRNLDADTLMLPHRRSCKVRFSLSEYPTLYKEMYITVSFPYIEPYTVYGIPNEDGNIYIEGVKVPLGDESPKEIGEYKPGTEIKTKTSPG